MKDEKDWKYKKLSEMKKSGDILFPDEEEFIKKYELVRDNKSVLKALDNTKKKLANKTTPKDIIINTVGAYYAKLDDTGLNGKYKKIESFINDIILSFTNIESQALKEIILKACDIVKILYKLDGK
jgi:hypothetical protein